MKKNLKTAAVTLLCLVSVLSLTFASFAFAEQGSAADPVSESETAAGKKIYLAAPLFSKAELDFNLEITHLLESYGYEVFLPQRDGYLASELEGKSEDELNKMIFDKDYSEVMKADIVFVMLDGRVPDEGACVELGIAFAMGKRCYGFKSDTRSVEFGLDLNPMITGCMIKVFRDNDGDQLIEMLKQYLSENEL